MCVYFPTALRISICVTSVYYRDLSTCEFSSARFPLIALMRCETQNWTPADCQSVVFSCQHCNKVGVTIFIVNDNLVFVMLLLLVCLGHGFIADQSSGAKGVNFTVRLN